MTPDPYLLSPSVLPMSSVPGKKDGLCLPSLEGNPSCPSPGSGPPCRGLQLESDLLDRPALCYPRNIVDERQAPNCSPSLARLMYPTNINIEENRLVCGPGVAEVNLIAKASYRKSNRALAGIDPPSACGKATGVEGRTPSDDLDIRLMLL